MNVTGLSDAQLLESLRLLVAHDRAALARLLAHLGEVEERRRSPTCSCGSREASSRCRHWAFSGTR
jgi:hypothetical protein